MTMNELFSQLDVPAQPMDVVPSGYVGSTGYLDQLRPEVLVAPVVKGMDKYDRKFIALRAEAYSSLLDAMDPEDPVKPEDCIVALTLFQRYTEDPNLWVVGGGLDHVGIICEEGNIPFPSPKKVRWLLEGAHLHDRIPFSDYYHTLKVVY